MPDIYHAVLIAAPAEKIYQALTTEEGLSAWWTPGTTAKPEPGTIARFPFTPPYFKEMRITELQPSRLVRWTCIAGADEWVGTRISFHLEPGTKNILLNTHPEILGQAEQLEGADGTLLLFHHDGWRAATLMYAECNYTWAQFLRSLKLFCETGKGTPWPYQHRPGFNK
ncbi:hypothetical protein A8C56_20905 [Niabella ginsenosidivorans]|uniref:Activator of Hsp90 ATPase homologue 1/2-like C-terminal domain-containing protein n=1 Tax=Niabella ginsenosidivorans TaxID=1176587 RepID=A0A1A9I8V2_9BACT|nr:SRPBCC domain-containing protein [Niabella ginsenosidivorans]ANH83111.1 hypothetical protein A8C56_20905 [Niabella ginsenosidivorans]